MFTVYKDHASLHWLLSINDLSSRLACWRLRIANFDFGGKCKKGKAKKEADVLLSLPTMSEIIYNNSSEHNPVFLLEESSIELELNRSADEVDIIYVS